MIACKERWISTMVWSVGLWLGVSALAVELPSRIHTAESSVRPKAMAVSALRGLTPQVSLRLAAPDLSVVQAEDVLSLQHDAKGRARVGIRRLLTDPIRLLGAKSAWTLLPDGTRVWSARLESEEALGIRVRLESTRLPAGTELRVFNADDSSEIQGPFNAETLGERDGFWTPSIFGSAVILEVRVSPDSNLPSFRITELTHRYIRLGEDTAGKAGTSTASAKTAASCNIDVSCEPAWATTSHAVAGLGTVGVIGELFCTGCLLNDLNESPKTDYFLTAAHCITSQAEADSTEFYWNYQTANCKGAIPNPSTVPRTVGGASILSTKSRGSGNDHCFMQLRGTVPSGVTYAGWNSDPPAPGEALAGIHHPQGDYKRISIGVTQGENTNFRTVRWTRGVTEVGSSGSPLFNAKQQVIGQLYGGDSDCSNLDPSQQIDEYGRFNVTFPTVRRWLLNEPVTLPANDNFSAAQTLSGDQGSIAGNTANASRETGEPDHGQGGGRNSIWYQWTASFSGVVTFETAGSDFDTTLGVYQGNAVNQLLRIAGNDDFELGQTSSRVGFLVTTGTRYHIGVDGRDGAQGGLQLSWHPGGTATPPLNDLFTDAARTVGFGGVYRASNRGYTRELLEPAHAGGSGQRSAWWRWTAPISGPTVINTLDSSFDTLLAVYIGNSVSTLRRVAENDDIDPILDNVQSEVNFGASAGVTYYIAVDGFSDGIIQEDGNIRLDISQKGGQPTGNNQFADATTLTGAQGVVTANNLRFTRENGEPSHGGVRGSRSAWWQWTAPNDGTVRFETTGTAFDTLLAVYTGDSVNALKLVMENDDIVSGDVWQSRLEFVAKKGTLYRIAVDGFYDAGPPATQDEGNIRLAWEQTVPVQPFSLTASRASDGRFEVRLMSLSGIRYALERTTDLLQPSAQWTRIATADGNGSELILQDTIQPGSQASYFRVVTVP
ncbi:MAG: trypsin-like peptidase domain-containing protein [Verrucomicrobiota bacterium]|jgi:hypothetical protein|nr:trypsin-like peptidase domain-containing protein [Verrucomicrobiota bacterium]